MASSNVSIVSDDSKPYLPKDCQDITLTRINQTFSESKADQILRLVRDQEELNKRFKHKNISKEERSDTEDSDKETEIRLQQRLSLHKQKGGRSKTSMGFNNDKKLTYSSDEDSNKMADENRTINTRVNRPKSSYVRRRHAPSEEVSENIPENTTQRRCRSSRPRSRLGNRDPEAYKAYSSQQDHVELKMVLKESTCNVQVPPSSPVNGKGDSVVNNRHPETKVQGHIDTSGYDRYTHTKTQAPNMDNYGYEQSDFSKSSFAYVDPSDYERYEHTKTPGPDIDRSGYERYDHTKTPGPNIENSGYLRNERTKTPAPHVDARYDRYVNSRTPGPNIEICSSDRNKPNGHTVETGIRRERTGLRNLSSSSITQNSDSGVSKAQYEKNMRNRQREDTMSEISPKRRHRRQQYNNIRSSRPTSENVYLVRQRTEARMLKTGNSTSSINNRPKSDRIVMTSNGPKPILSIDHNPVNNGAALSYQNNSVQQSQDYHAPPRPKSRRSRPQQEAANRSSGVITTRPPLSLMKLPPLDSSVGNRTDRIVLTTARETCV